MAKDLDSILFQAWLRYLKAETAEEDELPMKPDRSNYREVSCEVPVLFLSDLKDEWVNDLKQMIFDYDFILESCWME